LRPHPEERREATRLEGQPASGLPESGHSKMPKSDESDFGWRPHPSRRPLRGLLRMRAERAMRFSHFLSLFLSLSIRFASGQTSTPPKTTPSFTAQPDRTAMWVGDSLRYTLRVVHEGNVELVLDNFTRERLPLSPFMVRDIDIKRGAWTGGKRSAEITLT